MPKIKFEPSKKQHQAWQKLTDSTTRFIGYGGAAGGGKSWLGVNWLIIMCFTYPKTRWGLGRKELKNLKRSTLPTFFKALSNYGITGKHYNYNQQYDFIRFTNGSEIYLVDMSYNPSDPEFTKFGGLELTGAFVDESNECTEKAIDILSKRIRHMNKEYNLIPKVLETFNPSKDHVYWRYHKPEKEGTLEIEYAFIRALVTDNPDVDPEYIKQLQMGDKATIERYFHGNFDYDDDDSKLMDYDSICAVFENKEIPEGEGYISVDIARFGKDATTIFVWSGWRVVHADVIDKGSTTMTAQRIVETAERYGIPSNNIIIDEDGVGGGVVDMMRTRFPSVKGFVSNKSPIKRGNGDHNYNNIKSQCYFMLAKFVNEGRMYFLPKDKEIKQKLVQELEVVKKKHVDKDGKNMVLPKEDIKNIIGRSPDYSDALMMRMWFELGRNETKIEWL